MKRNTVTTSDKDEQLVAEFLKRDHESLARRFTKRERSQSQTPDFKVSRGSKLVFYCEVKTLERDDWFDRTLNSAPDLTPVTDVRISSPAQHPALIGKIQEINPGCLRARGLVHGKITDKIEEAIGQFDAVNARRVYPNVLFLVNHDDETDFGHLYETLTGDIKHANGTRHHLFGMYSDGKIAEIKWRIDLYVWRDPAKMNVPTSGRYGTCDKHVRALRELFRPR
jgi:hypothetical protein